MGEIFVIHISDKWRISRLYNESLKLNDKKFN